MQIWIENLKAVAKQSNFELNIVTKETLSQYLPNKTIQSINKALASSKLTVYESTMRQLLSLAILYEQGGVWVEPYAMFLDNLNWLHEIGK
jgi:hypothetical protein